MSLSESDGGTTVFGPDSMPGAEIVYCTDIGTWIFRHPNIITSTNGEGNECSWLWKSAETDDYDILSTNDGVWEAWVGSNGKVKPHVSFSVMSNECSERSDCNYHGTCVQNLCHCDSGYFGEACQFDWPCETLATEKAHTLGEGTFAVIFTRLMTKQSNLQYVFFTPLQRRNQRNGLEYEESDSFGEAFRIQSSSKFVYQLNMRHFVCSFHS